MFFPFIVFADKPIAIDSRIKVFVYNEYEVFRLTLHYGYHAHIDFGKGEFVRSVSLGNNSNWYIEPMGSKLFIQPYEKDIYTNMTVITNKRTYEFDLVAKDPEDLGGEMDKDLIYVVKFYYPSTENYNNLSQNVQNAYDKTNETQNKLAETIKKSTYSNVDNKRSTTINNKYSFVGDVALAPIEVFDDGVSTYIRFRKQKNTPEIYEIDEHDSENVLQFNINKGYIVITGVFNKLKLKQRNKIVEIFNDN